MHILQHPVLMNAAAVGKGVTAHDGLVGLHRHVHQRADHATRGVYLRGVDVGVYAQCLVALQYHGNLLERGIAGPLANAVDGNLHLAGTGHDAVEGVGSSHAQVVVAVGRDDGLVNTVNMLLQVLNLLVVLLRQTVARRIGNVDHRGTSLDDGLHHAGQILVVRTACILAVELHVLHVATGVLRSTDGALNDFLARTIKFIVYVLFAGAYARVDALALGILQRLGCHVNVVLDGTRQRTDGGPRHRLRNLNHRMEVTRTRYRKSCFNHVNAQLLQCLCHLNLLHRVQLTTGHLLAVAERRVENKQSVCYHFYLTILQFNHFDYSLLNKPFTPGSEKGL